MPKLGTEIDSVNDHLAITRARTASKRLEN
jgi:hypothetical protein